MKRIIAAIEKEKQDHEEILTALDARAKRLASMSDDERQAIEKEIADGAKMYDFLDGGK